MRVILLISLLLCGGAVRAGEPQQSAEAPPFLRNALGCLVAADFIQHDLEELALKPGSSAWVRYYVGSIPGGNPTPGEFYIAVYAEDGLRGWLLLADRDSRGDFVAVRNAYRLTKEGPRWLADEGNGGMGTYKIMSEFATRLVQRPRYRVRLLPESKHCAAPSP